MIPHACEDHASLDSDNTWLRDHNVSLKFCQFLNVDSFPSSSCYKDQSLKNDIFEKHFLPFVAFNIFFTFYLFIFQIILKFKFKKLQLHTFHKIVVKGFSTLTPKYTLEQCNHMASLPKRNSKYGF